LRRTLRERERERLAAQGLAQGREQEVFVTVSSGNEGTLQPIFEVCSNSEHFTPKARY
jgi:hypothetical protein